MQSKKPLEQENSQSEGGLSKEFGLSKGVKLQPIDHKSEDGEHTLKEKKKKKKGIKGCCKWLTAYIQAARVSHNLSFWLANSTAMDQSASIKQQ